MLSWPRLEVGREGGRRGREGGRRERESGREGGREGGREEREGKSREVGKRKNKIGNQTSKINSSFTLVPKSQTHRRTEYKVWPTVPYNKTFLNVATAFKTGFNS